jgi:O-antigen ligase
MAGWAMIKAHPWLGVGLSNFPLQLGTYINQVHTATVIHPGTGVHNAVIGIWSELGLLGLGFFGVILFTVFNHGRKILARFVTDSFENMLVKGLLISTTGIFIASLSLGAYFRKYFWLPLILIEALYYYQYQIKRPESDGRNHEQDLFHR